MSPDSIRLIDKCVALQQNPRQSRNVARGLTRAVIWYLMADSWILVEEAATDIGACVGAFRGRCRPLQSVHHTETVLFARVCAGAQPLPDGYVEDRGDFHTLYQREDSHNPGM